MNHLAAPPMAAAAILQQAGTVISPAAPMRAVSTSGVEGSDRPVEAGAQQATADAGGQERARTADGIAAVQQTEAAPAHPRRTRRRTDRPCGPAAARVRAGGSSPRSRRRHRYHRRGRRRHWANHEAADGTALAPPVSGATHAGGAERRPRLSAQTNGVSGMAGRLATATGTQSRPRHVYSSSKP